MLCDIFPVPYRGAFRWKWRHVSADGSVEESVDVFALYYECILAARSRGFQAIFKAA